MLTEKQVEEIREHLDRAQNPVFFFDNDVDGLCSFLILQRSSEKGKGVAIKSFPDLSVENFRKVQELGSDYIFVLDKPLISKEFFEEANRHNVPIVWIDHHDIKTFVPEEVNYYNSFLNKLGNSATTSLCYQVSRKKEDLWLATIGSISDRFMPEFYSEFKDKYPDLAIDAEDAFDVNYKSKVGKIVRILSFALKDRTTNVVSMIRFLMKVKSPYEVLEESKGNQTMHERFNEINSKYQKLIEKAERIENSEKLLFFKYSGDLSISSDVANELNFKFPDRIIVVAFISGMKVNISARGKNVRKIILESIKDLKNSTGGGHKDAVGAKVMVNDLEDFKKRVEEIVEG
jgi:single-stranded DNA-specific DHH superfamily exonuclease